MNLAITHVAAGVIKDPRGLILVALRPAHVDQGGLWEFPGGKVEPGETVEQALYRELKEELGICVVQAQYLLEIPHLYTSREIRLHVFSVTQFEGEPEGLEGQAIRWVTESELNQLPFPNANQAIIDLLQQEYALRIAQA